MVMKYLFLISIFDEDSEFVYKKHSSSFFNKISTIENVELFLGAHCSVFEKCWGVLSVLVNNKKGC